MIFRTPRSIKRTRRGIEINLGPGERELLRLLVDDLDSMLDTDDPSLRRLFPTAYHDDPVRDAEFQILARAELTDRHRHALERVRSSIDATLLDPEAASSWMQAINQIRLVLGTRLDVSEDEPEWDPESEEAPLRAAYAYLGMLLDQLVSALGG